MGACYSRITWNERLQIEALARAGFNGMGIARELGRPFSTIYKELRRGAYEHTLTDLTTEIRYSPNIAEDKYQEQLHEKGPDLKIGHDHRLAQHIEKTILEKGYSPAAVLGEILVSEELHFDTTICVTTLYKYIDQGLFLRVTNKDLPVKPTRKHHKNKVRVAKSAPKGKSIEKRPPEIDERKEFGHWEMDCVIGRRGTKGVLLVLTERLTRKELIIPMRDKTAKSVVRALNRLERRYGTKFSTVFKTITVDNGTEFSDSKGIERSCLRKTNRTTLYYCHPYCSSERGSNENQNRMIRRRVPKGSNIGSFTAAQIQEIEEWVNNYPRRQFGYRSANDLYNEHMAKL